MLCSCWRFTLDRGVRPWIFNGETGTVKRGFRLLSRAFPLALATPTGPLQTVRWREGTAEALASRFAAVRARPAQGDHRRSTPRPEHWLVAEWPIDETAPAKFWLSNLPADIQRDFP